MSNTIDRSSKNPGISIVLPALNEEDNVEILVDQIKDYFKTNSLPYEIIIVDDGSTDQTGSIADRLAGEYENITVIHHPENQGYGKSLRDGFHAGRHEYLFYTDADLQFKINSLDLFVPYMQKGTADMVVGYRVGRQDPWLRKFLAWGYNKFSSTLFSLKVKDIDCAFKLFKKQSYLKLELLSNDFLIDTEILTKARTNKFIIEQVGVQHYPRAAGETTVSFKHILETLKGLAVLYFTNKKVK
jgi:glycosyltransferase involved in cell wall biosynthesis